MTFQELAIRLNYNGPSGAEKAYKAALRKLKRDLYGGAYGRWLSAQKAIRAAKAEAERDAAGRDATDMVGGEELAACFIYETAVFVRVYIGAQRILIKIFLIPNAIKRPFRALHG